MLNPISAVQLHKTILNMMKGHKNSYIDTIIAYCNKNNIDPEIVGKAIKRSSALKSHIAEEAEALNLIHKTDRLNF